MKSECLHPSSHSRMYLMFMYDKKLSRQKKQADSYLLAEGLMDGKVVATHKVTPTRRPSKLLLWADDEKVQMKADGSDIVTVIAAIADENGNIKRLNNYEVKFEIEGQGQLVANEETFTIHVRYFGELLRCW